MEVILKLTPDESAKLQEIIAYAQLSTQDKEKQELCETMLNKIWKAQDVTKQRVWFNATQNFLEEMCEATQKKVK